MLDDDFWPEVLVQELRHIVRSSKFDFDKSSRDLNAFWLSDEAEITARDRGQPLPADKSSIEITPDACRKAFARDYSNAPYQRKPATNAAAAAVATANENVAVNINISDEDAAGAFDLDGVSAGVVLDLDADKSTKKQQQPVGVVVDMGLGDDSGPSETYDELMDRLEQQQQANYERKEKVFAKVARILNTYTSEDGNAADGDEDSLARVGEALAKSMGLQLTSPQDQEVQRAYLDGINQRRDKKKSREELALERKEREELQAQRDALRRRFEPDSVDAQGDAFEFVSPALEGPMAATIAATTSTISSNATAALGKQNAKVLEVLQAAAPPALVEATSCSSSSAPDLIFGFLDSTGFDELLTSLEAEQAAAAASKSDDGEESDLAEVLRMLDEEAAKSGKAEADWVAPSFGGIPGGIVSGKPKVMLKAGLGVEDTRPSAAPVNPAAGGSASKPTNSRQHQQHHHHQQQQQQQQQQHVRSSRMQQQQEPEDDSESGDESDDDAWRNRRKNLKNKADTRIAATASDADADNSVSNAVYGFGGVNGGARAPGANVKAVSASAAAKVITTTVRASDRAVAVAAEEEKSSSRSCDSSPTSSPSQTALSMRSPDSVSSPGVDTTWHDVASPSPAVSPNNTDLPRPPTKIIIEVDEEEPVIPIAPPEKTETSGLLGGASAQRSRKGKKGGKLINVSKK